MIKITLVGTDKVVARFEAMSQKVRAALVLSMKRQWFNLQGYVVKSKLSGGVLRRVTGNLASSINVGGAETATRFDEMPNEIVGSVGTRVVYGAVHEYGGSFNVKPHTRRVTQVFGRPVTPTEAFVRGHTVRFPERSFLRSSLQDMSSQIRADMERSVRAAMAEV